MKTNEEENVEEILKTSLPSVSTQYAESVGNRVLKGLQSGSARVPRRTFMDIRPPSRLDSRWGRALAMAAAIAIIVLIPLVLLHRAPAVLEDASGSQRIQFGEVVHATDGAASTLVLADTSRVEMRAKSELSIERAEDGVRIQLRNGDIIVNAAKQHGHLYVQTKEVTVSVVGTVFLVKAEAEGSRVAVIEGEVHVHQGSTETKLHPGEQVASNPKMETIPVKDELGWSRQAESHIALMEQLSLPNQRPELPPRFELASIRPSARTPVEGARGSMGVSVVNGCAALPPRIDPARFAISQVTVFTLIAWAYTDTFDASDPMSSCTTMAALNLTSGGPGWIKSEQWDIEAVIPESARLQVRYRQEFGLTVPVLSSDEAAKIRKMIRSLLEERLKVMVRDEVRESSGYALTMEKGASPKFTVSDFPNSTFGTGVDDPKFTNVWNRKPSGQTTREGGTLSGKDIHMQDLTRFLSQILAKPVVDRTGFVGPFSFILMFNPPNITSQFWADRPNVFTALEKQVGLKLEETKVSANYLLVDHVERPSEN